MYFASRIQAGRMLAAKLVEKYCDEKCAVLALGDGGAMVGAQIANQLHCVLMLLQTAEIMLPREPQAVAGITSGGTVVYNHSYSDGALSDLIGENLGFIEQEKLSKMHDLNQLVGTSGTTDKQLLKGHNVIIVSDGLKTGFEFDLAVEFLKPIDMKKMIAAVPFASVPAVDRMHVQADELYCLNVLPDYISTDHYYEAQEVIDHETVLKTIENIVLNWK